MGRATTKPISLPEKVSFSVVDEGYRIKGPLGEVHVVNVPLVRASLKDGEIVFEVEHTKKSKAMLGTLRSLIENAIHGVTKGFEKRLLVRGTGFKVEKKGNKLDMALGFTHPVIYEIPKGIDIEVIYPKSKEDKELVAEIVVKGVDKQQVGQVAAEIRAFKPPEPYKGKGIRYKGEYVRKKLGKRAIGAGA